MSATEEALVPEILPVAAPGQYVPRLVLSAVEARNQVDAIKEMQRSVLTENVDYGMVPGTDRPALFKSGGELLLKVHGLGHHFSVVEVERDEHGRKFGVTYRCHVTGTLPTGQVVEVATCDGYCGYDETKYYQSTAQLEARERANASFYKRQAKPQKWAEEYRAPWNTVVKMAQKRALVGAALQATAASGLFTQDVEDLVDTGGGGESASPGGTARAADRAKAALAAINELPEGVDRSPLFRFVRDNGRDKMSAQAVDQLEAMLAEARTGASQSEPTERRAEASPTTNDSPETAQATETAAAEAAPPVAAKGDTPKWCKDLHVYATRVAKEAKLDDADQLLDLLVWNVTGGRTTSTKELADQKEATKVTQGLRDVETGSRPVDVDETGRYRLVATDGTFVALPDQAA